MSFINSFKEHLVPPFPLSGASLYLIPDQSALAARRRHLSVLQGKASVLLTTEENNDLSKVIDLPELAVGRHVPPPSAECAERLVKVRLAGITHTWPLPKSSLQKRLLSFFFSWHTCILCENYPAFLLVLQNSMALITGLMTNGTKWSGVFQITYFCTIYWIFWVHKYAKCIHTEKLAKSQCTIHALPTSRNWVWIDGSLAYWWWRGRCGVIVPAHVSIPAT